MKNSIIRLLFLSLLTASTALGANYLTLYKERIVGAEQYSWIDPVIDGDGDLAGFVFCDAANKKLIIQTESFNQEITTPGQPEMTVNQWVSPDSLVVYCMFRSLDWYALTSLIGVAHISINTFNWYDTIPPITIEWGANGETSLRNIRLTSPDQSSGAMLLFEAFVTQTWLDMTQGTSGKSGAQSMIFDSDLRTILLRDSYYGVTFGTIDGSNTTEYAGYNNSLYFWDYSDWDNPGNSGRDQGTQNIVKRSPIEQPIASWGSVNCNSSGLFVGDFRTDYANDEIIYIGCQQAAGVAVSGHGYVAACFSFASGQRQLLWYNYEDRWDKLDLWHEDGSFIAGKRGSNVSVFMNTRIGQVTDSATFPHDISSFRYFETGTNPKHLNLVGRVFDTIIVYQFDEITDVEEPHETTLPSNFSLSQNYPNPFNPTTTIEFEIPRRSTVKLIIYNTLGQQVRTLVNESLHAGNYSRIWDGKTDAGKPVSSGVYFYQASGDAFSQSKKMILLK